MIGLLTPLLSTIMGAELRNVATATKRKAIFVGITGIFTWIGIVFLLIAAFLALVEHYNAPIAALLMAAAAFIIALIVLVTLKIITAAERKKRLARIEADKSALLATAAIATIPAVLKRPILAVMLPLAGIAALALLSGKKSNPPK